MNALKRIFGRDDRFFDLLEASAVEAQKSAELLARLRPEMDGGPSSEPMSELSQHRRSHKRISQDITREICTNFVTPLEREDIDALSSALYKITKTVEKLAERLMIAPPGLDSKGLSDQIAMLADATIVLVDMVKTLRKKSHAEKIQSSYERLQAIEGDADKCMLELLRELYCGAIEAKEMLILQDFYELVEKAIDRCRDAGNVVFQIMLKYS